MKKTFRLVTNFNVQAYQCGIKAGDILRLRRNIVVQDHTGTETGQVLNAGELWKVLPGSKDDPGTVRLLQPDGKLHTWDDNSNLLELFEIVPADGSS
jgi:hypothetical protein